MRKLSFACVRIIFVVGLLMSAFVFSSCSKDSSDDGMSVNENGFKIIKTATDKSGAASVRVDRNAQSVSLVFNVSDSYTITTDGSEWLSITSGESGEKGVSRGLKLRLTSNIASDAVARKADVFITIGQNEACRLATIMQMQISFDPIVEWVDERLSTEYYWLDKYNELKNEGEINYKLTDKEFLTDALTGKKWYEGNVKVNEDDGYQTEDGWHLFSYLIKYSATKAATKAATRASSTQGFGIELCYTVIAYTNSSNYAFLIDHVYPDSPAYDKGLRRGDIIKQVDGLNITSSNYQNLFNMIQQSSSSSISLGVQETDAQGESRLVTYSLASGGYYASPVAFSGLLEENEANGFEFGDKKIGYISYLTFDSDFDSELIAAIDELSKAGATDLIIDLRTNGGGSVDTSSYFASMLLPESYVGKEMVTLKRHPKNEEGDSPVLFVSQVDLDDKTTLTLPHFDLKNVYFITSEGTASASEMLIMGLRAQGINAVTIGKRTMGKDCGMDVRVVQYGSVYYEFAPITFMNVFPGYDVDFSDGIAADVDFDRLRDQITDEDVREALRWYPMPEVGGDWGNYLVDIALGETVAKILGGTIFSTSSAEGKIFRLPTAGVTRSGGEGRYQVATIAKPKAMGMYVRSEKVVELEVE